MLVGGWVVKAKKIKMGYGGSLRSLRLCGEKATLTF